MKNLLIMKRPASFYKEPWREGTPLGNGLTGAVVYGNVGEETILFNRYDLWHSEKKCDLPDVSKSFVKMREYMHNKKYNEAKNILCDELVNKNYKPTSGVPFPAGVLKIKMPEEEAFKKYRRYLRMDTGESEVTYNIAGNKVSQKSFVSRTDDVFVWSSDSEKEKEFYISFDLHDDGKMRSDKFRRLLEKNLRITYVDEYIFMQTNYGQNKWYGAVIKADGAVALEKGLYLKSKKALIIVKCFSGSCMLNEALMKSQIDATKYDYEFLYEKHKAEQQKLYGRTDIELFQDDNDNANETNEALLDEAYYDKASTMLIEKLWRFGRYLFISGTNTEGLPFPQYGLWNGLYEPGWAQYVANENIEMMYWHVITGNLQELMKPLIKFYCSNLDEYRDYAKKLFGCKGIFVSVYSSPVNRQPCPVVPVIINCINVAGWLSQLFYKYYRLTQDDYMLKTYIYPFMFEAAEFYMDYIEYDKAGNVEIIPSVSPENTPGNFKSDPNSEFELGHPMPVTKNAVIDLAIIKELLTNLLELHNKINVCYKNSDDPSVYQKWKTVLNHMPDYMVSSDGGIKEWNCSDFEENYRHRHFSHIYPVFPGEEVMSDDKLFPLFERAVDLRKLPSQSGWSLCHLSAIYSVFGRGNSAMECIDNLCKSCIHNNLMTMHNDYRNMGITLMMENKSAMQLDANMGTVNAIQMMLFFYRKDTMYLLNGISDRLKRGSVTGFAFEGGTIDFAWDMAEGYLNVNMFIKQNIKVRICVPKVLNEQTLKCCGRTIDSDEDKYFRLEKDKKYELNVWRGKNDKESCKRNCFECCNVGERKCCLG